jgi:hypothetical protein
MSREWNGSQVMGEFAKIAAESGLITTDFGNPVMGNPDKETPVKDHRRYEPSKEYGVTKETAEDLVEKAHPKDARPAEAMGDGGLVENIIQQQKKDIEVATQMPSGALTGKHAKLVNSLVSFANKLEGEGKADAAARIDRTIERLAVIPFDEGFHKESIAFLAAIIPALKAILWGGAAVGAAGGAWHMFGTKLTSSRENMSEDIQDIIDVANSVGEDPALSRLTNKLREILLPYVTKFKQPMPTPGQEAELKQYLANFDSFSIDLKKVTDIVTAITAVPGEWYKFGLDAKSRLKEKLSDVSKTFSETVSAIHNLAGEGEKMMGKVPSPAAGKAEKPLSDIVAIQQLLVEQGLKVPQSGKLDSATKNALQQLEKQLEVMLWSNPKIAEILEQRKWTVSGLLLRQDGTVVDPETLRRLIALTNKQ